MLVGFAAGAPARLARFVRLLFGGIVAGISVPEVVSGDWWVFSGVIVHERLLAVGFVFLGRADPHRLAFRWVVTPLRDTFIVCVIFVFSLLCHNFTSFYMACAALWDCCL
jgi:hypothetical protein